MPKPRVHCPFCGADRNEIRAPRMSLRFVECVKCGARGPKSYKDSAEAVALWNARAKLAPVVQLRPRAVPGFERAYFGCEDDCTPD
jgi:Lar family restriction alleviation protein